jgi:hypothetical protein
MLTNRSSADGLRCSPWNALASAPRFSGYPRGLALQSAAVSGSSRASSRRLAADALRFYAAPWMTTRIRQYRSCSRFLQILNRVHDKLWPLAAMDDFSNWLLDGPGSIRLFLGALAGTIAALFLIQGSAPVIWLQTLAGPAISAADGAILLILGSVLVGLTVLPAVLARLLPLLTRLLILGTVVALAAWLGHCNWHLIPLTKFF